MVMEVMLIVRGKHGGLAKDGNTPGALVFNW